MRKIARFIAPALVAALGISAIAPGIAEAAPRHEAARYTPNREAKIRSDIAGLRSQIDQPPRAARSASAKRPAFAGMPPKSSACTPATRAAD